ncbi:pyridine nucleotide-disulfide oxidoreductase [Chytriomyces sp. MP71]|nr:pyridine nucleotide-disulfide oxidoreductase [Chytriomyces sp. MP71]
MSPHYDVLVIGAGSGSKLVRPVASLGYKVAVVEKDKLGGTCLNRGCIPSKMLIHPADLLSTLTHDFPKFGVNIDVASVKIDQSSLVERTCNEIDEDSASIAHGYDKLSNVTRFAGVASFVDCKTVSVTSTTAVHLLTADKIFIATGCQASIPDIPGLAGTPFLTYRELLRSPTTHESMIVIGGGYIACELGYYAARVGGTRVTFLVREKMLRGEDEDVRAEFEKCFAADFDVRFRLCPTAVRYDNGEFTVIADSTAGSDAVVVKAKSLFVATGVTPDTNQLHLVKAGIETDARGFIRVNDRFETRTPGIYAFGDCIGRHLFKHVANFEGEWLFKTLFARDGWPGYIQRWTDISGGVVYPPIPHAVFSYPQVAGVGLKESQAVAKYGREGIVVGRCDVADVAMGAALRATSGFVKLLFSKSDRKLVGAQMVGEQSSVVIHTAIAFMQMRATVDDLLETIYVHPALVEVVRDAARDAASKIM